MKTADLISPALDWAVAKCEGPDSVAACYYDEDDLPMCRDEAPFMEWEPAINWAQGGPIIEREKIRINAMQRGDWYAEAWGLPIRVYGPTPLIAAMRCYCVSKLGEEVDVPEELI